MLVRVEQIKGLDAFQMMQWMGKQCRPTSDAAKAGIQTNYYGVKNVTEALLPLLQASSDGRVVNVSSDFGLLSVSVLISHHTDLNLNSKFISYLAVFFS